MIACYRPETRQVTLLTRMDCKRWQLTLDLLCFRPREANSQLVPRDIYGVRELNTECQIRMG